MGDSSEGPLKVGRREEVKGESSGMYTKRRSL